jgi:hypothetical protein
MSLLPGYDPNNLQDVLTQQAQSANANLTDQYQQNKKRLVSQQAASGRLESGVSDYPLTDLQTNYTQGQSGIQDQLATALAGIPAEDWLNSQNFQQSLGLANQIANANKPSTLDEIFQGIGTAGGLGAAAFGAFG